MTVNILDRYTGAILAVMPGANLIGANFGGRNITNADLSGKDLSNAIFTGCNCAGSTFQNSNLTGANFFRSNVQGSDMRGITRTATSNFHACFFEDMVLDLADQDVSKWALPAGYSGQSNAQSIVSGPTTLPDASIPFAYNNDPNGTSGGVWGPLVIDAVTGDHGAEVVFAQTLKALGLDIGISKITHGATTMADWVPPSPSEWTTDILASLPGFVALQQTVWPGKFARWSYNWYLGEDDARAVGAGAALYGPGLLAFLIGISGLVGNNVWKFFTCVRTQSWIANAVPNSLFNCRYWETLVSQGRILNTDDLAAQPDNVHLTVGSQDILGARWATLYQAVLALQRP